jgi:very-short-patch-repair endonuclease
VRWGKRIAAAPANPGRAPPAPRHDGRRETPLAGSARTARRPALRRQHPIGPYVLDFACPAKKIAIELDSGQHALREPEDAERTAELGRRGYRAIRFWNNEVMDNLPGVLETIMRELEK